MPSVRGKGSKSGKGAWADALAKVGPGMAVASTRKEREVASRGKRMTRQHLQRRQARRAFSSAEDMQRRIDERLEALEATGGKEAYSQQGDGGDADDDSDFDYDDARARGDGSGGSSDEADAESDAEGGGGRRKRKAGAAAAQKLKKAKAKATPRGAKHKGKQATPMSGRGKGKGKGKDKGKDTGAQELLSRKPRPLARHLLEDRTGMAARYAAAAARPSQRPTRHFCTVTGWLARQRDSASGMRFATRAAYEQIREQPPPWARLSGIAPHHEAMRILAQQQQGGGGSNGQDAGQEEYY